MSKLRATAVGFSLLALSGLGYIQGPKLFDRAFAAAGQQQFVDPTKLPSRIARLPVILEEPAGRPKAIVLFLSGDGGWRGIDESIASALARQGYLVAGLDSVIYFDKRHSPDGVARDSARILSELRRRYGVHDYVLAGYSFGADVLPFVERRLPEFQKRDLRLTVLIGASPTADFWLGYGKLFKSFGVAEAPTRPEIAALGPVRLACFYGAEEDGSLCPSLKGPNISSIALPGSHHFNGDYDLLARRITALLQ
ncbi:virulence protein (VirJ) [Faunimonas pinastri]|uniref:Virulence protein (VirJ) n=1 Tax=Faunimonas pinastri TaxID=1855383 RepID=A0A1H9PW76_9HYPH|nr:AcvB/VirJ family lysyl-phosphatidylglycerol hydrolase [Faunimonas pinastri]SER52464.1 virulence protein (VirJ) [Faunimonas pinastri]